MVAIDRFMGSVAGERKFNAVPLWQPVFKGKLTIACPEAGGRDVLGAWAWLLLAFVLRDWQEGDGLIGSGASRGYGTFRAEITVSGEHPAAKILQGVVDRSCGAEAKQEIAVWEASLQEMLRAAS
jgi:CRISPR/Cas system CSM-associated protein Csm3 (group 7 of RAMP superfamily)